jgi:hypothetical protein
MKKLISAVAIAAVGIVSLAASPARADEHGYRGDSRDRAPYSEPARGPYSEPVRAMPAPRVSPMRYYRQHRWEAERARERRALEERREEFYSQRHSWRQRARFERWYADRCHDLDSGLRIDISFPF